ncbi:MAG: COX15/CtaA family protein [Nitriliruptoraceae bacterium]
MSRLEWLRTPSRRALRGAALAALIANMVIVFTGGIVRVTGSGLGCSDWPTCDGSNISPIAGGGGHEAWQGYVEFGNRLLSAPVLLAALLVWWFVRRSGPHPRVVRVLAALLPLGVMGQIVLGGVTVLTGLSPVTVAGHFLASMVLIAAAAGVYELVRAPDGEPPAARGVQHAMTAVLIVAFVVLVLGTLVTGSGPHGGDLNAPRFGFDLRVMAIAHADAVWLLLGLTGATVAVTWRSGPPRFRRTLRLLLLVQLGQGGLGYLQYWLGVPPTLVSFHILGATIMWAIAVLAWGRARDHASLVGGASQAAPTDAAADLPPHDDERPTSGVSPVP